MYRFYLDEDGDIVIRKFRRTKDVRLVMMATVPCMELLRDKVSSPLREYYSGLQNEAVNLSETLEKLSPLRAEKNAEEVTVTFSEDLLRVVKDKTVLASLGKMNWFVDGRVSNLCAILGSIIIGWPLKAKPAKMLKKLWFEDKHGKEDLSFLMLPGEEQWLALNDRFADFSEKEEEAIDLLGIRKPLEDILVSHKHHGVLLGVTKVKEKTEVNAPSKKEVAQTMDLFNGLMGRIIAFANIAWPTEETAEYRKTLLGPYMDRVDRLNQRSVNRKRRQAKSKPEIKISVENMQPEE